MRMKLRARVVYTSAVDWPIVRTPACDYQWLRLAKQRSKLHQLTWIKEAAKQDVPMLTYDYHDVVLGAPDKSHFELASLDKQVEDCDLHTGGFPYLHLFHYFVKL